MMATSARSVLVRHKIQRLFCVSDKYCRVHHEYREDGFFSIQLCSACIALRLQQARIQPQVVFGLNSLKFIVGQNIASSCVRLVQPEDYSRLEYSLKLCLACIALRVQQTKVQSQVCIKLVYSDTSLCQAYVKPLIIAEFCIAISRWQRRTYGDSVSHSNLVNCTTDQQNNKTRTSSTDQSME